MKQYIKKAFLVGTIVLSLSESCQKPVDAPKGGYPVTLVTHDEVRLTECKPKIGGEWQAKVLVTNRKGDRAKFIVSVSAVSSQGVEGTANTRTIYLGAGKKTTRIVYGDRRHFNAKITCKISNATRQVY